MGHQRLGKLAATKAWRDIVSLIAEGDVSVDTLADAVLDACDKSFALAKDDPAFREAMFLLCKIPMAACEENLGEGLRKIGLDVPDKPERTDIIAAFEDAINNVQRNARSGLTDLGVMAKEAAIAVMNNLLTKPAPAANLELFGDPKSGTHLILKQAATPDGFCDMAQSFYATFGTHNIQYFLDRVLPLHLGKSGVCQSIPDMIMFEQNNVRHNQEASYIMRTFAREWYAKAKYQDKKELAQKDVAGFASIATEKMRKEYRMRNIGNGAA